MIRFRTPGPIGGPELRAMNNASAFITRTGGKASLPHDLAHELRVLGITVEPVWPGPEGVQRLAVEGTVA